MIRFLFFNMFPNHCSQNIWSKSEPNLFCQCKCLFAALTVASYSLLLLFNLFPVVAAFYIQQFQRGYQINHLIFITFFVMIVQSIYISYEFTNIVTNCWLMDSWLLWRRIYWETAMHSLIWQRCQVNHWILDTCFFVGFQSLYINNEVTDRVIRCLPLGSLLLWKNQRCIHISIMIHI